MYWFWQQYNKSDDNRAILTNAIIVTEMGVLCQQMMIFPSFRTSDFGAQNSQTWWHPPPGVEFGSGKEQDLTEPEPKWRFRCWNIAVERESEATFPLHMLCLLYFLEVIVLPPGEDVVMYDPRMIFLFLIHWYSLRVGNTRSDTHTNHLNLLSFSEIWGSFCICVILLLLTPVYSQSYKFTMKPLKFHSSPFLFWQAVLMTYMYTHKPHPFLSF